MLAWIHALIIKIKIWFFNLTNRPFFELEVKLNQDGTTKIAAHYNAPFIYDLDRRMADIPEYQAAQDDNDKVLLYVYDLIHGLAEPLLPEDELVEEDPAITEALSYQDAPVMAFKGGVENKTIVDIGNLTADQQAGLRGVSIRG